MNALITEDIFEMVLEFFYTISHWIGEKIVSAIQSLFPYITTLNRLIDPIGMLVVLTIVLLIAQVAKKIAWIIVIIGWILILIRVVFELIK